MRSASNKIGNEMNFSVSKEAVGSSILPIFSMIKQPRTVPDAQPHNGRAFFKRVSLRSIGKHPFRRQVGICDRFLSALILRSIQDRIQAFEKDGTDLHPSLGGRHHDDHLP